jgi:hypothetical protein
VRRSAFDRFGLFNEAARVGEFIEWFVRAQARGCRYEMLSQPLLLRRIHAANASKNASSEYANLVRALRHARVTQGKAA